ncbi:FAD-binding protein [Bacillus massilinigeriensis]|uniref:FAD-binding protein n=1 Tax=Bacillus massilionigeriensis TaxID=1805475 RepID=UPI00096AEE35|nr:FAD-binding protein [Bacillus massilionigeriensis]
MGQKWDKSYDVIVIGFDAGSLTAAITAKINGMEVLIIGKNEHYCEIWPRFEGEIWIPNNYDGHQVGVGDSFERARAYLNSFNGCNNNETITENFLYRSPEMIAFLQKYTRHVRFQLLRHYPDYYPEILGGLTGGRTLRIRDFVLRIWSKESIDGLVNGEEPSSHKGTRKTWWPVSFKWKRLSTFKQSMKLGKKIPSAFSMFIRYFLTIKDLDIEYWLSSSLHRLVFHQGKVSGVIVERGGQKFALEARKGVIVSSEGLMEIFRQTSMVNGLYKGSLFQPDIEVLNGKRGVLDVNREFRELLEVFRGIPNSYIVDNQAKRFLNEAAPEQIVLQNLCKRVKGLAQFWLITDQTGLDQFNRECRRKGLVLKKFQIQQGSTLIELGRRTHISTEQLTTTAWRFNGFARKGKDEDYFRGASQYENYFGNKKLLNPNLAPIENPPFYAIEIEFDPEVHSSYFQIDEVARVLNKKGEPIEGLFAIEDPFVFSPEGFEPGKGAGQAFSMMLGYVTSNFIGRNG